MVNVSQSSSRKANLFEMATIDVHFHGLVSSETGEGNVTTGQVNSQIDVLNEAFRAHGFQFRCVTASCSPGMLREYCGILHHNILHLVDQMNG